MLALENEFTSLVVHRRPRGHYTGVPLRSKRDNFQCRIERISGVHLLEELACRIDKRNENVADILREERSTWSREGENL